MANFPMTDKNVFNMFSLYLFIMSLFQDYIICLERFGQTIKAIIRDSPTKPL